MTDTSSSMALLLWKAISLPVVQDAMNKNGFDNKGQEAVLDELKSNVDNKQLEQMKKHDISKQ